MAQRSSKDAAQEVFTREIEPGLVVYHVDAEPPAEARRKRNGQVDHARETAALVRQAIRARRRTA